MKENVVKPDPGTWEWRQMVHKYKGYTGEQQVFDHLESEDIEVPTSGGGSDV
jgi:hypothetical protein